MPPLYPEPQMRRPFVMLSLMLLILGAGLSRRSPAQEPGPSGPPPAGGLLEAKVALADGSKRDAKLFPGEVEIRNDDGVFRLKLDKIKRITWHPPAEGKAADAVELLSGERLHGEVVGPLRAEGGDLSGETAQSVTFERAEDKTTAGIVVALVTLSIMEIVLGIDNVIFLAIIAAKLPTEQQPRARRIGLMAALGTRIILLFSLTFLMQLTKPLFTLPALPFLHGIDARQVTARDLILLLGGLFLIIKSVHEIHAKLEEGGHDAAKEGAAAPKAASFAGVLVQIALIDILFSLDSVITAIGIVDQVWIMVVATCVAMVVMLAFAGPIAEFVNRHPTVKVLALSFLILIGAVLILEGFGGHVDKGYVYFAMGFAFAVEALNLRGRKKGPPQAAAVIPPAAKA